MNSSNPEETRITSKESQNCNKVSFKIISFRIVSKITVNCKGNGLTIAKFHHIYFFESFRYFEKSFEAVAPKVISTDKNICKVYSNVNNIASTDVILKFRRIYCEVFCKKGVLFYQVRRHCV